MLRSSWVVDLAESEKSVAFVIAIVINQGRLRTNADHCRLRSEKADLAAMKTYTYGGVEAEYERLIGPLKPIG